MKQKTSSSRVVLLAVLLVVPVLLIAIRTGRDVLYLGDVTHAHTPSTSAAVLPIRPDDVPNRSKIIRNDEHAGFMVHVLDAVSGRGIDQAKIRARSGDTTAFVSEVRNGAKLPGVRFVEADTSITHTVTVVAPGYVTSEWTGTPGAEGVRILLALAGSLEVRFSDHAGAPLSGVDVQLLPPVEEGPAFGTDWRRFRADSLAVDAAPGLRRFAAAFHGTSIEWTRRSDEDGHVLWSGLPPASGYRVGLVASPLVNPVPTHEDANPRFVDGQIQVATFAPRDLTGEVHVLAGERHSLSMVELRAGEVRGVVHSVASELDPNGLVMVAREYFADPGGESGYLRNTQEARTQAGPDGAFRFEDVRPGFKTVQAFSRQVDGSYRFALRPFELAPGESVDLGFVAEMAGGCSVELELNVRSASGELLSPSELWTQPDAPFALIRVSARTNEASIAELLPVRLGEPVVLHGLPCGIALFSGLIHPEARFVQRNPSLRTLESQAAEVQLPHLQRIDLEIPAEEARPVELEFLPPAGATLNTLELWIRAERDGAVWKVPTSAREAESASNDRSALVSRGVVLATGAYEIFAKGAGEQLDAALQARIEVGSDSRTFQFEMQPAVRVTGHCFDANGSPSSGLTLRWSFGSWQSRERTMWLYGAVTQADGSFEISGVVPGVLLHSEEAGLSFRTDGPGHVDVGSLQHTQ